MEKELRIQRKMLEHKTEIYNNFSGVYCTTEKYRKKGIELKMEWEDLEKREKLSNI